MGGFWGISKRSQNCAVAAAAVVGVDVGAVVGSAVGAVAGAVAVVHA